MEIEPGSQGAAAGLRTGDVITELNGKEIENISDIRGILDGAKSGDSLAFYIRRGANSLYVGLKVD
ncbi:PDZ domain-containing protein [bacterium]|nr:PDZ domain-containing protein [candidate division CSSED10-310 bacterium]